jgi:hypothetical protein
MLNDDGHNEPSPAQDFGWHDPGYIHSAVMTGLKPSNTFSYRYGRLFTTFVIFYIYIFVLFIKNHILHAVTQLTGVNKSNFELHLPAEDQMSSSS